MAWSTSTISSFFFFQVKEKHRTFISSWTEVVIIAIAEEGMPQGSLEEWEVLTPGHGVVLTGVVLTGDPLSQEVQVIDVLENVMYQWILETSLRLLTIARLHALIDVRGRLVSGLEIFPFFSECYSSWARCIRCFKSRQNSKLLQKVHNNNLGTFFAVLLSIPITL